MENKITLGTLATSISEATGKSRKFCEDFLREFFRLAAEVLETGAPLKVKGFGSFKVMDVEARTGVNVANGEKQEIASYKKVVFTPAKELAQIINMPFADFNSVEIEDEVPDNILEDYYEEELMSDENLVSDSRLEEGSEEEGSDDEITYEAYHQQEEDETPSTSPDEYNLDNEDEEKEERASVIPHLQEEKIPEEEEEPAEVVLPVYDDEEQHKSRFGLGFLTGSLSTLVVCIVIFMLGCFFGWWPINFGNPKDIDTQSVEEIVPMAEEEPSIEEVQEEPVYDTVSTTRYLTTIAREHYGNFNFWPYIYIENESILGHPDRITPGTRVIVPDLSKYGVDANNPQDIETAKIKGREIYARYK